MSDSKALINVDLRPDVARALEKAAADTLFTESPWRAYGQFKERLSRVCGWDAPRERYDPEQYRLAMKAYLAIAKL